LGVTKDEIGLGRPGRGLERVGRPNSQQQLPAFSQSFTVVLAFLHECAFLLLSKGMPNSNYFSGLSSACLIVVLKCAA
jgi:hypothetical protein